MPIRVIVAEDQGMVLGALVALLEIEKDMEVVGRPVRTLADASVMGSRSTMVALSSLVFGAIASSLDTSRRAIGRSALASSRIKASMRSRSSGVNGRSCLKS